VNTSNCLDMCAFGSADNRGVDVQYPWEDTPRRFHHHSLDIGPFYIDQQLVTNDDFAQYLRTSRYSPRDPTRFLQHWHHNGSEYSVPRGDGLQPVRYVSLDEARDYCHAKGKRLPHSYEWQLAAQSTDGRTYPWGHAKDQSKFPVPSHGRVVPKLPDVHSYPGGDSPHNVSDAVGLLWQYTDSFVDDHTLAVVLKGSSLFNPILSGDFPALPQPGNWYFPTARKLTQHNRLMLLDDSYDRAATVGFRCAADHPSGAVAPYHIHNYPGN